MTHHQLPIGPDTVRVGVLDQSIPPVLEIASGDTVNFQTAMPWADAVTLETTLAEVLKLRTEVYPDVGPHSVTGPVFIRDAEPGDVLRIDIRSLRPRRHGFNVHFPGEFGAGLLPDEFSEGAIRHFEHDLESMTVDFGYGVTVPLEPFLGIMAVAPPDPGPHSTVPPGVYGGNMDLRELTAGTTLYLPVWVEGALFSVGDAHSRQGHGEVCQTALETAMDEAVLAFTLLKGLGWRQPRSETPTAWITMGFDADLLEAARQAATDLLDLLETKCAIPREDAYGLCSIAADLVVTQVVNRTRGVHARIDKALFRESSSSMT